MTLICKNCGKGIRPNRGRFSDGWRTFFLHSDVGPTQGMRECYRSPQCDVYAEVDTDTWEGFEAAYIWETGRAVTIDMDEEREYSPMIVVKYGEYRMVLNPMALKDHLCVDVHAWVDGEDARTGIFGMDAAARGSRINFDADNVQGTSHGWPAASLIALLLGKQAERSPQPEGPPYTVEGCEHCAGCGELAWECVCAETAEPDGVTEEIINQNQEDRA